MLRPSVLETAQEVEGGVMEDQGRLDIYLQEEGARERMAKKAEIPTIDDWTAELARLMQDDPGNTVHELARQAGMTDAAMRSHLDRGVREGRYIVGKARRPGSRGRINVYRVASPPPATSRRRQEKPKS